MRHLMLGLLLTATAAAADPPEILDVRVAQSGDGRWRFDVTLAHPDSGWEHYADGWEILGPDGARLGFRELLHPHVNEQPFTRSLGGVAIPEGLTEVRLRARCSVDGWSDETLTVPLP